MEMKNRESVWDYPRPPRVEAFHGEIRIVHKGITVAKSTHVQRVLETSHPPVYYLPREDVSMDVLYPTRRKTICEFKGEASYWGININGKREDNVAWSYENPWKGFEAIKGHLAFYAGKMDACYVKGEKVVKEPGSFYGGWITSNIRT